MTSRSERKQQRALARHGKVRPQSKPRAFFAFLAKTVAVVAISALTVTGVSAWELSQSIQGRSIQLIGADGKAFNRTPGIMGGATLNPDAIALMLGSFLSGRPRA